MAQRLAVCEELVEVVVHAEPAVPEARRTTERDVGVAADVDRHLLLRRGSHLDGTEVVELAVVLDPPAGPELPHDLDHLVHAGATLRDATEAFQRRWLEELLQRHAGHLSNAAREAGMDRSNFHRLLRKLGLRGGSRQEPQS